MFVVLFVVLCILAIICVAWFLVWLVVYGLDSRAILPPVLAILCFCLAGIVNANTVKPEPYINLTGYVQEEYAIRQVIGFDGLTLLEESNRDYHTLAGLKNGNIIKLYPSGIRTSAFVLSDKYVNPVCVELEFTGTGNKVSSTSTSYLIYMSINDYLQLDARHLSSSWEKLTTSPIPIEEINSFAGSLIIPDVVENVVGDKDNDKYGLIESKALNGFEKVDGYYAIEFLDGTKKLYPEGLVEEIKGAYKTMFLDVYRIQIPDENGNDVNIVYYKLYN